MLVGLSTNQTQSPAPHSLLLWHLSSRGGVWRVLSQRQEGASPPPVLTQEAPAPSGPHRGHLGSSVPVSQAALPHLLPTVLASQQFLL